MVSPVVRSTGRSGRGLPDRSLASSVALCALIIRDNAVALDKHATTTPTVATDPTATWLRFSHRKVSRAAGHHGRVEVELGRPVRARFRCLAILASAVGLAVVHIQAVLEKGYWWCLV